MEKTLTFTVEDALISPIGLSILSGAGFLKGVGDQKAHFHMTTLQHCSKGNGKIDLTEALGTDEKICAEAPLFIMEVEDDGSLTGKIYENGIVDPEGKFITCTEAQDKNVMVDYYVLKKAANTPEIQINASDFAGYYYVEAQTMFRKQVDGVDAPVNITLPNVKIQSNFTFTMASSGDPSTVTFTMDAMPGYTYFNKTKKVMCVMQILEDSVSASADSRFVMAEPDVTDAVHEAIVDSAAPAPAQDGDAEGPQGGGSEGP